MSKIHLLAKDKRYCCNRNPEPKPENSTSDPEKVTCKNCHDTIEAYKSNHFYRQTYILNRGKGIEL